MIGLLLVTHGDFAKGIVDGMELICGPQKNLEVVGLRIADDVEVFAKTVKDRAKELDQGDGVLILADFMSGSPANVVCRFLPEEDNIEGVAGLNFPMLLEAVNARELMDLKSLTETCCSIGAMGVLNMKEKLREYMADVEDDE